MMSEGGGAGSSLPAAGSFVVGVPVLLLTLDGAVGGVPAAVVHGLLLTVVALRDDTAVTAQSPGDGALPTIIY